MLIEKVSMLDRNRTHSKTSSNSIVKVSGNDLKPGELGKLFRDGAKAVVLTDDQRVGYLWNVFVGTKEDAVFQKARNFKIPWENSIFNVALNHQPNNCQVGDMFRFCPGIYGYFGRKLKVYPAPDGHMMQTIPNYFSNGDERVTYPNDLLRMAWELMSDIFKSTLPESFKLPPYAVAVEILKYPNSLAELEGIFTLLSDAAGGWTRLGRKLDSYKGMAPNVFRKKVLHDLFACASLIPGVNKVLQGLSRYLTNSKQTRIPENTVIIGNDHVDTSKLVTCLASERDVIHTQLYDGKEWLALPLTRDTLTIFPSKQIDQKVGIPPTRHRILLEKKDQRRTISKPNITLSLAVVNR